MDLCFVIGGPRGLPAEVVVAVRRAHLARPADDGPPARPRRAARAALPGDEDHRQGAVPPLGRSSRPPGAPGTTRSSAPAPRAGPPSAPSRSAPGCARSSGTGGRSRRRGCPSPWKSGSTSAPDSSQIVSTTSRTEFGFPQPALSAWPRTSSLSSAPAIVLGDDAPGIADHVGLALAQAEEAVGVEARVHAGEHRHMLATDTARRRENP